MSLTANFDETEWFLSAADRELLEAGIDPDASFCPPDERDAVRELWHSMQIAHVHFLDTVLAWDRVDAHLLDGARNPTAWLRHKLRVSHGHAGALLRQARGLRDAPRLRHALVTGELSFDQADQLIEVFTSSRASYVECDIETLLAHMSELSVFQCRNLARHWAARVDSEAVANGDDIAPPPKPTVSELRLGEILDGDTVIEGTLNASDASVVRAALTAAHRLGTPAVTRDDEVLEDGHTAAPSGPPDTRTPSQQRADAWVFIAQFFLDHHDRVARATSVAGSINRAHVNVHINLDELTKAHLTGNPAFPYNVSGLDIGSILQTCCDASITRIVTAGPSLTLDIGRETRVVSPTLRKAVATRDRTCRFPGCDMPAWFTDVHHIVHWVRGGPTDRENCCLLCRRHHTLVHKGGWTITGNPNAELYFTGPENIAHRSRPPAPQLALQAVPPDDPNMGVSRPEQSPGP